MADASQPEPAPPPVIAAPPHEGPPPPPPAPAGWGQPPGWGSTPGWGPPPGGYPPPPWPYPYGWHPQAAPSGQVGSGRFRSMNVGELLDAVFSLYRRNFILIAAISAIVQVPYAVLTYLVYQLSGFSALQSTLQSQSQALQNPDATPPTPAQLQGVFGTVGTIFVVSGILAVVALFIVQPLAVAATTRAVSDRYLDHETTIGTSYRAAFRRLGALIVQSLILVAGSIVVFGGAIAVIVLFAAAGGATVIPVAFLVIIGIGVLAAFLFIKTSLAVPAIVLENLSGWRGLARSWELVRGLFWRLLGIRLLLAIITGIISSVVVLLITLAGAPLDINGRFVLQEVASALAAVFVSPITYIAVTLLYYDTRIRKEAFDIEMLAQAL